MSFDFLIIGGGIAGISVAARLSHHGKVAVLERETALAYHTSGRSAALFEASYGLPSAQVLSKASENYHKTANGGVLSPRGLMVVGHASDEKVFAHELVDKGLTQISIDEARAKVPVLNPDVVRFAGYHAHAWDIDTDLLLNNFAREARQNGATIHTSHPVTAIKKTGGKWQVTTSNGTFAAPVLVNAAGAWVDQVARMAGVAPLGFTPCRRSVARIPAPGGHDVRDWPMMLGAGETWYAKPDAGKLIVSPADEDPSEPMDAWPDDMVLAEGLARYESMVTTPVERLENSWAGLRTFAPDRKMVAGFAPDGGGFFWHAGQGGNGFQTSPAASQLAADLISGRVPDMENALISEISPKRFAK